MTLKGVSKETKWVLGQNVKIPQDFSNYYLVGCYFPDTGLCLEKTVKKETHMIPAFMAFVDKSPGGFTVP